MTIPLPNPWITSETVLIILVLLFFAVRWLVRHSSAQTNAAASTDALDVAKRRLAAGEISIEQFEEIQKRIHP